MVDFFIGMHLTHLHVENIVMVDTIIKTHVTLAMVYPPCGT
jgi:uncharacterized protein YwlG (UPF0340 family)